VAQKIAAHGLALRLDAEAAQAADNAPDFSDRIRASLPTIHSALERPERNVGWGAGSEL
jgi:hypothetical protein